MTKKTRKKAPVAQFLEASQVVGNYYWREPRCGDAAMLLREIGRLMGYTLDIRQVSIFAHDSATGRNAMSGNKVLSMIPEELLSRVAQVGSAESLGNGHVVLTCAELGILIDPTASQFTNLGVQFPNITMNIADCNPESGQWSAVLGDVSVWYILDDEATPLVPEDMVVPERTLKDASDINRMIRSGMKATDIGFTSD